jgi:protocatechuate 3,4-dioxygenase beta subunit
MSRGFLSLPLLVVAFLMFLAACSPDTAVATNPPLIPEPELPTPPANNPTLTMELQVASSPTPDPDQTEAAAPQPTTTEIELVCPQSITLTPAQTEGPYYTPNTPERSSLLEEGIPGERLVLTGYVLKADCEPVAGAWLDFWQADGAGVYDNSGFRLRGHQYSDEMGRYRLETVYPGEYPGRTPHIHVKVMAPGGAVLTTQIYFAGEASNARDFIFRPELVTELESADDGWQARFDFYISTP